MKNIKYKFHCFLIGLTAAMLLASPGVQAGQITRVSVSSAGVQGNSNSFISAISADGRYVAFTSIADNLVSGDTNGLTDVFVRDRLTGKTTLASVSSTGGAGEQQQLFSRDQRRRALRGLYIGCEKPGRRGHERQERCLCP